MCLHDVNKVVTNSRAQSRDILHKMNIFAVGCDLASGILDYRRNHGGAEVPTGFQLFQQMIDGSSQNIDSTFNYMYDRGFFHFIKELAECSNDVANITADYDMHVQSILKDTCQRIIKMGTNIDGTAYAKTETKSSYSNICKVALIHLKSISEITKTINRTLLLRYSTMVCAYQKNPQHEPQSVTHLQDAVDKLSTLLK
jgi:hypothetical protein